MPRTWHVNWKVTVKDGADEDFGSAMTMAAVRVFNQVGEEGTYEPVHMTVASEEENADRS